MKYLLSLSLLALLASPSLAASDAYKAAKAEWRSDWKDTKSDWKDAGKPEPKPTKPAKPQKSDY